MGIKPLSDSRPSDKPTPMDTSGYKTRTMTDTGTPDTGMTCFDDDRVTLDQAEAQLHFLEEILNSTYRGRITITEQKLPNCTKVRDLLLHTVVQLKRRCQDITE